MNSENTKSWPRGYWNLMFTQFQGAFSDNALRWLVIEVIPNSHGRKLVEASPAADKSFHLIRGAGHNDLFEVAGDEIIREIAGFARRVAKSARW